MAPEYRTRHGASERIINPELLDDASGPDVDASLQDLVRINRYFGGYSVASKLLRGIIDAGEEFTILDIGAASGDMGRALCRGYPNARITSLDYRSAHLTRTAQPKVAADAFALPFAPRSYDFVFCSLFLHHFEQDRIIALLAEFKRVARRAVLVIDLERGPIAFRALPLTNWLFGWNRLTLHDGPISVEAAFKVKELEELARAAGFAKITARRHRPWARISLIGEC